MNKSRFVLDSCIIIKHLNHELALDAFFASKGDCEKFISVITFIEVLASPDMTADEEAAARDFLSGCVFMDITAEVREKAILIRRFKKKVKLPDCVIAATAIALNAALLSTDDQLLRLEWPGFSATPPSL
jgi:predicted nucleic acid-binding protein